MNTERESWIDDQQRRALVAPIEAACGLPGRFYSADFYALERGHRCRSCARTTALSSMCSAPPPAEPLLLGAAASEDRSKTGCGAQARASRLGPGVGGAPISAALRL